MESIGILIVIIASLILFYKYKKPNEKVFKEWEKKAKEYTKKMEEENAEVFKEAIEKAIINGIITQEERQKWDKEDIDLVYEIMRRERTRTDKFVKDK